MSYKRELFSILSKAKLLGIALIAHQKYHKLKTHMKRRSPEQIATFRKKANSRTILIDVSSIVDFDHGGGIQRVQRSLIEEWCKNPPENFEVRPIYFSFAERTFKYVNTKQLNEWKPQKNSLEGIIKISKGDIYFNTDLNYRFVHEHFNFFQLLRKHDVKVYFMIYDLLPIAMPHAFPSGMFELHSRWMKGALEHSFLICISNTVKEDCLELASLEELSVEAASIRLGQNYSADVNSFDKTEREVSSNGKIRFLVVSTIEIRKRHELILDTFEILWEQGFEVELTFVGKPGWKVEELLIRISNHRLLGRKFFWKNNLSDHDLSREYLSSNVLINASLGEGFGLPLVEASAYGIPLILRDIPVFREVAGDKPWYFKTNDPLELSELIKNWMEEFAIGNILVENDRKIFSWKDTCSQIIEVFKQNDRKENF
jgi:glycosyltransferase involved in cell wall biosynthesis